MNPSEVIDAELSDLRKNLESCVEGTKLVACVPATVRIEFAQSAFKKLSICLTFPSNYPEHNILVELKSKTLSAKLLDGLVKVTEEEAKKYVGRPHILRVVKFIRQFFEDHPLSCCSEEISKVKAKLAEDGDGKDKLRLSQKTSSLTLHVAKDLYYFKVKISVPHEYPDQQVSLDNPDSNFPRLFRIWFVEQAKEIARRCVVPPLKPKPKDPPFEPRASLLPVVTFLVNNVKRYPDEICQACRRRAIPTDPAKAVHDDAAAAHAERVYCSHTYHHDCLILYMKTPPFEGGKKCHACKQRIYHEKWKVTPELAEARWAHEQAKSRELGEVIDFFGDLCNVDT